MFKLRNSMVRYLVGAVAAAALLVPARVEGKGSGDKDIFGWVEQVLIGRERISLKAKLDTGADTSSVDATITRRFRRKGKSWVEFELRGLDNDETVTLEKRLARKVRIKQHDGSHQSRLVVEMEICLGRHLSVVEVSLIDRSEFIYPVLLGRSALEDIAVVDPSLTFTQDPDCEMEAEE